MGSICFDPFFASTVRKSCFLSRRDRKGYNSFFVLARRAGTQRLLARRAGTQRLPAPRAAGSEVPPAKPPRVQHDRGGGGQVEAGNPRLHRDGEPSVRGVEEGVA